MEELGKKRVKTKSVQEATPLQRIFFMVAGAVMNFIGAFVILVIAGILGHRVPQSATVTVFSVAAKSPAASMSVQPGDVITAVNGKPVQLSMDVDAAAAESKAAGKTLDITILRSSRTVMKPIKPVNAELPTGGALISSISDGSPAAAVLKTGDVILKADSTPINTIDDLLSFVGAHAGKSVQLTIERNGDQQTVDIVPREQPPQGQGPLGIAIENRPKTPVYSTFGLVLEDKNPVRVMVSQPLGVAISDAWEQEVSLIERVVTAPIEFLKGKLSPAAARPVSAVGIGQMAGAVARQSIDDADPFPILGFAAVISIALGITNLLPIPALDGGRILFVLIEILRGKPMNPEREGLVHLVGLMLLLGLTFLLAINDIIHPINLPLR